MSGAPHRLTLRMTSEGVEARLASAEGDLLQKVADESANHAQIVASLPASDVELIAYHTRAKAALDAISAAYNSEKARINALWKTTPGGEVTAKLSVDIIRVAAEFRLDDFVRRTFNVADHIEAIRAQVEDQIEKHAANANAIGDGMAYTAAAAEAYLGWVHPTGQRHVEKCETAVRVIEAALAELDRLNRNGIDMTRERMYVRGKNVADMCSRAMNSPGAFLWSRGEHVVKGFVDDMIKRGLRGNGGPFTAAKRRLGIK
jgi:hypothetical protein